MISCARFQRRAFWFLAAVLVACHGVLPPSAETLYHNAREHLESERLDLASAEADKGLAAAPKGSKLAWDLWLLRVEILLARREGKQALEALRLVPPETSAFTGHIARHRLCQAHAALLLHDISNARKWLDEAQAVAETLPDAKLRAE